VRSLLKCKLKKKIDKVQDASRVPYKEPRMLVQNEDTESFIIQFSLLGNDEKEIFRKLQFYSQKNPVNYVSQGRIAKNCGCSRIWVNKAIKKFVEFGWMGKMYRYRKTCIYFLKDSLKCLNIAKWLAEKWSHNSQKVNNFWSEFTRQFTLVLQKERYKQACGKQAQFSNKDLPEHIKNLSCSEGQKIKLAMFPKDVYIQALKSCKAKKVPIDDAFQYLFGSCRKICEERKIRPKWELLYG
jgi:hypothetical protein